MRILDRSPTPALLVYLASMSVLAAACGGEDSAAVVAPPPPPATGAVEVVTATGGADLDPDGYSLTVDGSVAHSIGLDASMTIGGLSPGSHPVALEGVAANCSVAGENPRSVSVLAGETDSTTFVVSCTARTGTLSVTTATTGSEPDTAYTLTVDGGAPQTAGSDTTVTLSGVSAGDHSVALGDVAANCAVSGANPRTVTVPAGGEAQVTFSVDCSPTVGGLSVTTATTGQEIDPDGYVLSLDGGSPRALAVNDSLLLTGLPAGGHTLELAGIAPNCTVTAPNPRTVDVTAGATAATAFEVTCVPTTGDLLVTSATAGQDLDPDGYVLSVDGGSPRALALNDSLLLTGLPAGGHALELAGIAPNCTVTAPNPRTVDVTAGATAATAFEVTCAANVGDLLVTSATTGQDLDPDGYTLTLDGGAGSPIGVTDTVSFTGLAVGSHTVELTGLASNCSVWGANPTTVDIVFGAVATAAFDVSCAAIPPLTGKIVFHSNRDGDFEIYAMNADGSGIVQLTHNTVRDLHPAVSPDGSLIAFATDRDGNFEIYTMRADGTNPVRVTNGGGADREPSWSPDGKWIAFIRSTGGGTNDIFTIRPDGTGQKRLTNNAVDDREPSWSPDGLKIAFTTDRDGNDEVYTMNASDGSAPTNLTNHPGLDDDPDWSPDGSLILFHRNDSAVDSTWLGDGEVMCMRADGTGVIRMTTDTSAIVDWGPSWAPGGNRFVFVSNRDEVGTGNELYVAPANGCASAPGSVTRVTSSPGKDEFPDWAP